MKNRVEAVCLENVERIGNGTFYKYSSWCVIFYGTIAQFNAIDFGEGNGILRGVRVECTDGDIIP